MVKITDTTLRDGQQSLIATRLRTEEMLPVLELMDKAGFHSIEMWGGATFDSCLRFLKEDPWERLRKIKAVCRNTKLQMLFRGQNMLGYKIYPNDLLEAFIRKSIENGIDIVRAFDAMNDIRNLESTVKAVKKENAHIQLSISYTTSKVHTIENFVKYAKQLENLGADSICVKDMSGLLLPVTAYELVKALKKTVKVPIQVHSHCTTGLADMSYLKAIEAGADIIDTAMSPFALGTSQPATEVFAETLQGTEYDPKLDTNILNDIARYFAPLREAALKNGLLDPKVMGVDINALLYQVPGGMLSNLISQLKTQNAENKLQDVLTEIPKVREDLGSIPLVTPTSQIVGNQAVLNVLMGERYKMISSETKDIVRGKYGKTPAPISADITKKIIGNEKTQSKSPADLVDPVMKKLKNEVGEYYEQEEDLLSYGMFPQIALEYFKFRQAKKYKADPAFADLENKVYPL